MDFCVWQGELTDQESNSGAMDEERSASSRKKTRPHGGVMPWDW